MVRRGCGHIPGGHIEQHILECYLGGTAYTASGQLGDIACFILQDNGINADVAEFILNGIDFLPFSE